MIESNSKQAHGPVLALHPQDNVWVARTDISIGTKLPAMAGDESDQISSLSQVPAGHKIAVSPAWHLGAQS